MVHVWTFELMIQNKACICQFHSVTAETEVERKPLLYALIFLQCTDSEESFLKIYHYKR
jgi:hypothetical protein